MESSTRPSLYARFCHEMYSLGFIERLRGRNFHQSRFARHRPAGWLYIPQMKHSHSTIVWNMQESANAVSSCSCLLLCSSPTEITGSSNNRATFFFLICFDAWLAPSAYVHCHSCSWIPTSETWYCSITQTVPGGIVPTCHGEVSTLYLICRPESLASFMHVTRHHLGHIILTERM